jgi:hypothetical protein
MLQRVKATDPIQMPMPTRVTQQTEVTYSSNLPSSSPRCIAPRRDLIALVSLLRVLASVARNLHQSMRRVAANTLRAVMHHCGGLPAHLL